MLIGEFEMGEGSGTTQILEEVQKDCPTKEEETKVTTKVSLNVLMSLDSVGSSPATIKILGRVKKYSLVILIDCGSTHRFIDPNVPKMLGLHGAHAKIHAC